MPSSGFKPAIPATMRLQTYALDRTATKIGKAELLLYDYYINTTAKHGHRLSKLYSVSDNVNTVRQFQGHTTSLSVYITLYRVRQGSDYVLLAWCTST